jgi:type IV fimbrial biogenesis protein FimT
MHYGNQKPEMLAKDRLPFICHNAPFVCNKRTSVLPLIGKYIPFVGIKGFSLIELIITLTVVGILVALAAPGMQRFFSDNRLTTQINDLLADISLARSEAIKRNTSTGMCVTAANGTSCVTSGNWANGWLVYYCSSTTNPCPSASKVSVKAHEPLTGNNSLSTPGDEIVFSKTGMLSSSAGQVTLTDTKTSGKRIVCVGSTGRPTLSTVDCPT